MLKLKRLRKLVAVDWRCEYHEMRALSPLTIASQSCALRVTQRDVPNMVERRAEPALEAVAYHKAALAEPRLCD
jgi:hypothetical protein